MLECWNVGMLEWKKEATDALMEDEYTDGIMEWNRKMSNRQKSKVEE